MIELDPLKLTLFLFIAAAFGALAYALVNRTRPVRRIDLPTSYFRGLNYLLNEQQDKAIEVFLKLAESDKNALETQLALGHLFRRRGEVDRAIRLHQGLVTKASLSAEERGRAVLALGEDYMRAGLYDRAETLLQDALKVPAVAPLASLHLITIYQAERDWLQAIEHAKRYESLVGQSMGRQIGHFYCELAEQARHVRDFTACRSYIADAYRYD